MAKIIKYQFLAYEKPDGEQVFSEKEIICDTKAQYDANLPIAEKEAIGEINVDGEFEIESPTQLDRIESQITYTAMMTDTLLEV